jgi:hypothetical protein
MLIPSAVADPAGADLVSRCPGTGGGGCGTPRSVIDFVCGQLDTNVTKTARD